MRNVSEECGKSYLKNNAVKTTIMYCLGVSLKPQRNIFREHRLITKADRLKQQASTTEYKEHKNYEIQAHILSTKLRDTAAFIEHSLLE
jgi:hypothetical protein